MLKTCRRIQAGKTLVTPVAHNQRLPPSGQLVIKATPDCETLRTGHLEKSQYRWGLPVHLQANQAPCALLFTFQSVFNAANTKVVNACNQSREKDSNAEASDQWLQRTRGNRQGGDFTRRKSGLQRGLVVRDRITPYRNVRVMNF